MASVFCAFPMAVMMLATYVKLYIGSPAKAIWFVGVAVHMMMILYFTVKFLLHFSLEKVFASWFIVYVGIAMAGSLHRPLGPSPSDRPVSGLALWLWWSC